MELPQAESLWTHADLPISLELLCNAIQEPPSLLVFCNEIGIGRIALRPRILDLRGLNYRQLDLSNCKFDVRSLRYIFAEWFQYRGIFRTLVRNIGPFGKIQLSQKFGFQTQEYQYYTKLPPTVPAQKIDNSFLLLALKKCEKREKSHRGRSETVSRGLPKYRDFSHRC